MAKIPNPLRVRGNRPPEVLNIAHRGARAFAPENTLAAFEKAKTFGCDMFELDVHISKDRELIVHHDDDLLRCTDVSEKFPGLNSYFISDFTLKQIETLDAGTWYVKQLSLPAGHRAPFLQSMTDEELHQFVSPRDRDIYASASIRVPTLTQALDLAKQVGMMVDVELKSIPRMYPRLAESVVQLVQDLDLEHAVVISSFDHELLVQVRKLTNAIATAVLTSDRIAKSGEYLQLLDADAYNPCCYGDHDSLGFGSLSKTLDPRQIANVRKYDRGVNVWTCNDKSQMQQLIEADVTGLVSDYPNRVRDVLTER